MLDPILLKCAGAFCRLRVAAIAYQSAIAVNAERQQNKTARRAAVAYKRVV
jgi:hypothetical protein